EAVVLAVDGDRRQRPLVAGLAGHDLLAPAVLHVGEEIDAVFLLVGEDHIIVAVLVDVDETQTVIHRPIPKTSTRRQVGLRLSILALIRGICEASLLFVVGYYKGDGLTVRANVDSLTGRILVNRGAVSWTVAFDGAGCHPLFTAPTVSHPDPE